MGYANIQHTCWIDILRYHDRILELEPDMLPRLIYEWEQSLSSKGWISNVGQIANALHLPPPSAHVLYALQNTDTAALALSRRQ